MRKRAMNKRAVVAAALAAILGGCSGHSSVLPVSSAPSKPANSAAEATMIVKIPAHTASKATRKPAYISPGTKSIGFAYSGALLQTADVTPGSPGCTTDAGGNTTCKLTFGAVAGNIAYTVTAYDATGGKGNVLGVASASMTVTAGQDNQFSVTLDGVAASFKAGFGQASIAAGTPTTVPITISAYDAGGNLIVNSPRLADSSGNAYTATISTTDSTEFQITQNGNYLNAYQGSSTTAIVNQPYTGLAVNYNGGLRQNETVTFTQGNITAKATLNVSAPAATAQLVYAGWYYPGKALGGEDASGVMAFPGGGNGSINGVAGMSWTGNWSGSSCTSGAAESYAQLTTDANQDVAFLATSPCWSSSVSPVYPAIVAQAPGASTPAFAITQLPLNEISFGFDSTNAPYIWFDLGNQTVGGVTGDHAQIVVLKPGSTGAYDGATMVARTIDYVNNPETLLVAPDGTVYAAHAGNVSNTVATEAIDVFAPGANGSANSTAAPQRSIGGALTNLASIKQMALDSKGNLYVANRGNGSNSSITVYAPGASGDAAPIHQIQGSNTGLSTTSGSSIQGIGLDAFDNIYALVGARILVFAAGADGNVAPIRTMSYGGACCNDTIAVVK